LDILEEDIMATLVSPGVAVSVIDESAYASAGQGTVPLIILATAENKTVPGGTGLASKTLKSAAAQPVLLTSQRELAQLFGAPEFRSLNGTPLHGSELNEYGLLTAYSYLGLANRAYVLRADVDVAQLEATAIEPAGLPANGTYWLDTADTIWGLFQAIDGKWVAQDITVITTEVTNNNVPLSNIGSNGDYAVVVSTTNNNYFKKINGQWYDVNTGSLTTANGVFTTVNVAPHYQVPNAANGGDVWFKTTTPNKGFTPAVKRYSSTTGQFASLPVSVYANDAEAETAFGSGLQTGSIYAKSTAGNAQFELRRYSAGVWDTLVYEAKSTEPTGPTADGTLWYNTELQADIYVKDNGMWRSVVQDGSTVTIDTAEPEGPGVADVWVDTNDLENYPQIKVYDGSAWQLRNNADQTTPEGVVFADLTATPADNSNNGYGATPYSEVDTPDPLTHPDGMLLWNSMVSTYNVKRYDAASGQWHTISGNISAGPNAGAPYMGRKAQRQVIVRAMQKAVTENQKIREETMAFTLIAAPGYPELIDEMLTLNVDRKETAFVICDSPLRLAPDAQGWVDWVTGVNAGTNGEDGIVTKSSEAAVYYPSVLTTDLNGYDVVAPASYAVLRTYAYNDSISYPWFAPAGLTRGVVTNCSNFGYVNGEGEFMPVALNNGQRDTLYANKINPLVNFPGTGLVVFGQKTLSPIASALDRVNVARLIAYLRERFDPLARPFIFEPNDNATRANVKTLFDGFLGDIMQKRGIYDFLVVCDTTNNTPSRIDANELWIDIAIEPTKAAEFIYIPVRIVNTGALQ
jgi:hypothetical protein